MSTAVSAICLCSVLSITLVIIEPSADNMPLTTCPDNDINSSFASS